MEKSRENILPSLANNELDNSPIALDKDSGFTFPHGQPVPEDDDEVTESKIRAFLHEKVLIWSNICSLKDTWLVVLHVRWWIQYPLSILGTRSEEAANTFI